MRRRPTALLAGVLAGALAGVLLLLGAAPAAAHARLVATDPVNGSVLPEAPAAVTLTFSEPVRLTARRITVYDATAEPVASSSTATDGVVTTRLPDDLARGSYVVSWSVVSTDGHPISGTLTFSVGERSAEVAAPPPAPQSSVTVTVARAALQALALLGLLVAAGLAAYAALVLPGGGDRPLRTRLRAVTRLAAALAVLAAALTVPAAAAYAQGLELGDLTDGFDPALVAGELAVVGALVLGLGVVVVALGDRSPGRVRRATLLVGAGLAVAAPSLAGHTRAYGPGWLVLGADWLHVAAGAVWLGGLVGLALTLRGLRHHPQDAGRAVARFSLLAGGLLIAVAAAGALLGWRILGSWQGLVDTTYGRLLLVKVGIALLVATLGAWNRWRLLPRLLAGAADGGRTLRRTVRAEVLLLVVLLGVTGFLVAEPPVAAPAAPAAPEPVVRTLELGDLTVALRLSPGTTGGNTLEVAVTDAAGRPVEPPERPQVEVRSAEFDLGAVPVRGSGSGVPGRYRAQVPLPRPGEWELQVGLRLGRFESLVGTVRFEVPAPVASAP